MADTNIAPNQRVTTHLKLFNGLKGSAVLLAIWGLTFQFSWFSVLSNPDEVDAMRGTLAFNFVSGAVYTIPVFFFCSGFLQTLSFMQKDAAVRFSP